MSLQAQRQVDGGFCTPAPSGTLSCVSAPYSFTIGGVQSEADHFGLTPSSDRAVDAVDKPTSPKRNLWKWSSVAYGTANVLDVVSSVGSHYGRETNSLLTDANGNFHTGRAIAVKSSVFGATVIAEYLIMRKWPQLTKLFAVVNFGWSAAEAGVAAHNFTLRK
jgi:hypothetical protein